jgi:PKD repeat protein
MLRTLASAVLVAAIAAPAGSYGTIVVAQTAALRIIVLEGEDAVNLIDKKTAVKPTVEVRDRNDLPVAGALVRFAIRGRAAAFNSGVRELSLTTDTIGRATVSELTPLGKGAVEIQVNASYQGQTAAATIHQTNFVNAAQAAQAGKMPAQSGQSASTGSTGTTTATTTAGAAGGAGGGLSGLAIAGIVGGAAAGTAAAVAVTRSGDSTPDVPAPTVSSVSISPTGAGIAGATTFTFSAQGTNPAAGTVTTTYDFGDGTTGTGATATHVYNSPGTFTVRVTVANSRNQTAAASTAITIVTLSARWAGNYPDNVVEGGAGSFTLTATQSGRTLSGTFVDRRNNGLLVTCGYSSGTVADTNNRIQFGPMTGCVNSGSIQGNLDLYNGYLVTGTMDSTGNQIVTTISGLTLTRQ